MLTCGTWLFLILGAAKNLVSSKKYWGSIPNPSCGEKEKTELLALQTNLRSHLLHFFLHFSWKHGFVSVWIGITKWCMNRRKKKSLSDITCYWRSLIICIGFQRQHICSSFAARIWWAETAYSLITLISALFMCLLPRPFYSQISFCFRDFTGKMFLFFVSLFPSYIQSSMFPQLSRATTSHLVSCCIKLWHQPFLIVSRPGKGWVFILFSVS